MREFRGKGGKVKELSFGDFFSWSQDNGRRINEESL